MPESAGNEGSIIRYNVSVNDRCRTFHITGPTAGTRIHDNLVYIGPEWDIPLLLVSDWGGVTEEASSKGN
ncbi:hypothetical protein ICC18_17155 [Paenibacillus sp. WST5]|uniref:Uncharacterized protein n=2 Tax=Paenibacillus sedimenti TaxID=2770274 RepID=A0A926KRL5_9BACL|nr:hypothetical protein [Paenibacillus sedimenti]